MPEGRSKINDDTARRKMRDATTRPTTAFRKFCPAVGIVRGREARIVRQLTETLPMLSAVLDQKHENVSSDEEHDIDSGEEEDE